MRTTDKDGKVKGNPARHQQQLDHVTQLVKDAVGFDEARGDNVNVVNASFTDGGARQRRRVESPPFWESPLFLNIAKLLAGVTVLLVLVLSVLRPMVRTLVGPTRASRCSSCRALRAASEACRACRPRRRQHARAARRAIEGRSPSRMSSRSRRPAPWSTQDPKRVAQVVRGWVAQDE